LEDGFVAAREGKRVAAQLRSFERETIREFLESTLKPMALDEFGRCQECAAASRP
jgi:hypothetical protein